MLKIVHWGTGNTGMHGLRAVLAREDMDLVALIVHSEDKIGKDAGEIAGMAPVGISGTTDVDSVIAMDFDCLLFMAADPLLEDPARPDKLPFQHVETICRFLRAGHNVVSTTVPALTYPGWVNDSVTAKIDAACREGGTSYACIGIDPGFMTDMVPLLLGGFMSSIRKIVAQEMVNYSSYNMPAMLRGQGFGLPPNDDPAFGRPDGILNCWGSCVKAIAAEAGVELDEIRLRRDRALAEFTFDIPAFRVEKGTVAATFFAVEGVKDGEALISVQHITRLHEDIVPEWGNLRSGPGGYRIVMDGAPPIVAEFAIGQTGDEQAKSGDVAINACHATAARAVNVLPLIKAASVGVHSQFTLPLITKHKLFGS